MHHFTYMNNELHCEQVSLKRVAAAVDTPAYVYSRATVERHYKAFQRSFTQLDHLICFSMKACSNIAVLRLLANMGAGMDIVSGGELFRALKAGVDPGKIVYSGVGKKASEMDQALDANILMFNVESEEELLLLNERAQAKGKVARMSLRVNPNVDAGTHPYISTGLKKNKFGIDVERSLRIYRMAKDLPGVDPIGVDCHIGSQLTELSPFLDAVDRMIDIIKTLRSEGVNIQYLDIGGGLGIPYSNEEPPAPAEYGAAVCTKVADLNVKLILEPGRVLVGNAGVLVTRVIYQKPTSEKCFIIIDAAMNDLIRPSLYKSYHAILKVAKADRPGPMIVADLVGPICESGDFIAQDRKMECVESGDLLAIMSAGAYGFTMSSNYNSRVRPAEILVDGAEYHVVRRRETYEDLVNGETIPAYMLPTS